MKKSGATKHCSWGICLSDSRHTDKLPPATFFIRFPKPGKVKESMTDWEKKEIGKKSLKAKRLLHPCHFPLLFSPWHSNQHFSSKTLQSSGGLVNLAPGTSSSVCKTQILTITHTCRNYFRGSHFEMLVRISIPQCNAGSYANILSRHLGGTLLSGL